MNITKRGRVWHLRRRVPQRYASVDSRDAIYLSLHTDSETLARQKACLIWQAQIDAWEAKLFGDTSDAERRFLAAQELARMRDVRYLTAARVAELPREELLSRVEMAQRRDARADPVEAAAVLGGVSEPPITLSRALALYWSLARDRTLGKSSDQLRRWQNPRKKAIRNLIYVIGDKPLAALTGHDMLEFRDYWLARLENAGLTANSANKDLTHLGDVLKTVNRMKRLNLVLPLSDLSFKKGTQRQRPAFSEVWIREQLLGAGALDRLNPQARGIVLAMINTGCRPSELAALRPSEIRLDDPVPHLALAANGRQLKSDNADRAVPLLGVSLASMRDFPEGFERYRENSAGLSGTVNKYLRENGLLETAGHSLYGLRHSFEDRMLAAGIDERIRRDLMGHALGRERYGEGGRLSQVRNLLAPMSF